DAGGAKGTARTAPARRKQQRQERQGAGLHPTWGFTPHGASPHMTGQALTGKGKRRKHKNAERHVSPPSPPGPFDRHVSPPSPPGPFDRRRSSGRKRPEN
ncbi:hypothetical protein NHX12_034488, partial [Muraenolepis orangiensis]